MVVCWERPRRAVSDGVHGCDARARAGVRLRDPVPSKPAFRQPLVVPVTGGGIAQGHATEHLQQSLVTYDATHAVRLTCHGCVKGG